MDENRIKIVIDDAIPFIQGVFEPYAEVVYKGGRDISKELKGPVCHSGFARLN